MASLLVPLMEWGGFAEWISKVHPTCFIYDPPFLIVGCKDGVVVKLSADKVQFVSGSDNPSHAYPIDFLFNFIFKDELGKDSGYLAIDRLGSLILLDAFDGRCLLFNSLNLDSVCDACAQENLLWIFQDDGVIKLIEMSTLRLLATHKEVKHGKLMATALHDSNLIMVYQLASNSLIKVKLGWSEASGIVKEGEEMLELEEEAISAEILKDNGVAYCSHSAVHFPNGESISINAEQKYLGHKIFVTMEDGKYFTESFSFPKKSRKRGLSFLHKANSSFELIDLESNSKSTFAPHSVDFGVTKTYFDHSTLTVYKGYANGILKRLIAENVFTERDSVEFERKEGAADQNAIVTIYHSRRSGRIWTGHLNGDYSQWDPITRTCTSVISRVHREAPVLFIESPEGWEPKIILIVAADHSLSISTNTGNPQLISDLPLETGRAKTVIWATNSRLVIHEQEAFAKVWQLTGEGFELLEPLVCVEEIETCRRNARHLDDLHCCGDSGVKGVIRAVHEYSWSQLWGQLYMIDIRKLLSNELLNALGKEEDLKMCRAVLEGLGKYAVGSIGANNRISFSRAASAFANSIRQLSIYALAHKLNEIIEDPIFMPCLLSFLCKYWQDPNVHIKSAVRSLLVKVFKRIQGEELERAVQYWSKLLPGENARYMHRAAIILGLMITMDLVRDSILVKHVSETLFSLLVAEEGREMFRMAAIELLSHGLIKWQGYVHVGSLFRLVLSWAFALSPIRNVGVVDAEFNYVIVADAFSDLLQWDAVHGSGKVISQWCKDLLHSPTLLDRIISMELLHRMLSKHQDNALLPYLGMIVEMIVKLLDPSHAEERERLRPTMIPLLHSLVTVYKEVCVFDQNTQYLAVIAAPRSVLVYDLKSATMLIELHPCNGGEFEKIALKGQSLGALMTNEEACQLTMRPLGAPSSSFFFFRSSKPAVPLQSPWMIISHRLDECLLFFSNSQLHLCHGQESLIKL